MLIKQTRRFLFGVNHKSHPNNQPNNESDGKGSRATRGINLSVLKKSQSHR